VESIVTQYNLTDRLLELTCENASNNSAICHTLEDVLQSQEVELSTKTMKVSCLAHVLNLSARALLVSLM
jgi:hypothetical protein